MKKSGLFVTAAVLVLAGIACLAFSLRQPVTVVVDGQAQTVWTYAFTPSGVLRASGVALSPGDRVQPQGGARFWRAPVITVTRTRPVTLLTRQGEQSLSTTASLAGNILQQAGLKAYPGDRILVDGVEAEVDAALSPGQAHLLQFIQAVRLAVEVDGRQDALYSAAATLGEALWQAGYRLSPADKLDPAAETPLTQDLTVQLKLAAPVTLDVYGLQITTSTAAATVGEALAAAGISLQGIDTCDPEASAPIPASRRIRVVRAREQVAITLEEIPYKTTYELDPETELDQESTIQPGVTGLVATRQRILYEDGLEVSRETSSTWTARTAQDAVTGQGMKVVVRKIEGTDYEYWRKITVYATSYSPCRVGGGRCSDHTAIGLPVQKGVVAVTLNWFRAMRLQKIYVPGYGTAVIGDTGGGIPGRYWIDLAFSDDDYESWHQWVTIYFLTPVPQYIPYILYP